MTATRELLRIEGQGPVALAFALFLARQGIGPDAVGIDAPAPPAPALAARPLALSLGSWQLLARVAQLPAAAPIAAIEVSLHGRSGRTLMRAADLRLPALGYVVRHGALHHALAQAWRAQRTPTARPPASSAPVVPLAVLAHGDTGADARVREFGQAALLAEVIAARDAHGIAYERFTPEGPLALLPLEGTRRHALVWCAAPARAQRRARCEAREFEHELRAVFGDALGALRLDGERTLVPLQRRVRADRGAAPRIAIGNASQALHPVAGQGLNLGLRDAFELAQLLGELHAAGRPLADAPPAFARRRRLDRGIAVSLTDTLARAFTVEALAAPGSVVLAALDLAGPLQRRLASSFMFGWRTL